jgi:hypothetical protein
MKILIVNWMERNDLGAKMYSTYFVTDECSYIFVRMELK